MIPECWCIPGPRRRPSTASSAGSIAGGSRQRGGRTFNPGEESANGSYPVPEAGPATGLTSWAVGRGRRGRNHLRKPPVGLMTGSTALLTGPCRCRQPATRAAIGMVCGHRPARNRVDVGLPGDPQQL